MAGQNIGLDIIITDHHPPFAILPPAVAAVDPKRSDSVYPFPELAGVGVAFKFVQALFQATDKEQDCDVFLDLVALGTVADMVPLVGENRYLVKRGLEVLNYSQRPGLRQMVLCASLEMGKLEGMCTMDQALVELVRNGVVSREEAVAKTSNPVKLNKLLQTERDALAPSAIAEAVLNLAE